MVKPLKNRTWKVLSSEYLLREGFSIVGESLACEDRIYQIICAEYSGECEEYSPLELIFGRKNIEKRSPELKKYAEYVRSVVNVRLSGKRAASLECADEERLLAEIDALIDSIK